MKLYNNDNNDDNINISYMCGKGITEAEIVSIYEKLMANIEEAVDKFFLPMNNSYNEEEEEEEEKEIINFINVIKGLLLFDTKERLTIEKAI